MPRVVVDVMLKPEIADPQGQAVTSALANLGYPSVVSVRQGKRFEVEVNGEVTDTVVEEITKAAGQLLANPVIEDFIVRTEA